jgi:hypothetical protein
MLNGVLYTRIDGKLVPDPDQDKKVDPAFLARAKELTKALRCALLAPVRARILKGKGQSVTSREEAHHAHVPRARGVPSLLKKVRDLGRSQDRHV